FECKKRFHKSMNPSEFWKRSLEFTQRNCLKTNAAKTAIEEPTPLQKTQTIQHQKLNHPWLSQT
ncbi:MAG: hypothetical protein RMJ53_01645, partial [Chitinophagales bacterium]|nr:hypothetical protein [Chitinophagales bacterium]